MGILKKQRSVRSGEMIPKVVLETAQGFQIGVNSKAY